MKYQINDKLILHSSNGHDYTCYIVNINLYRPTNMIYALDIYDDQGYCCTSGDYYFCGEDWLNNLEYILEDEA